MKSTAVCESDALWASRVKDFLCKAGVDGAGDIGKYHVVAMHYEGDKDVEYRVVEDKGGRLGPTVCTANDLDLLLRLFRAMLVLRERKPCL